MSKTGFGQTQTPCRATLGPEIEFLREYSLSPYLTTLLRVRVRICGYAIFTSVFCILFMIRKLSLYPGYRVMNLCYFSSICYSSVCYIISSFCIFRALFHLEFVSLCGIKDLILSLLFPRWLFICYNTILKNCLFSSNAILIINFCVLLR